jgi:AGZA family xanthine/uracil permease-like MFS transporter
MAVVGFLLIVTLDRLRVRGAILIGIIAVTVLSFLRREHVPPRGLGPAVARADLLQLDMRGAWASAS